MKETNIEKYFTKKEKNVDINIRPLFINCIISIFSLCFLMDFYYFYHLLILIENIFVVQSNLEFHHK